MYNPYKPQCYQNFIVSQRDCDKVPTSGLYIENLTGISSEMVANTANSTNSTGADNLEDRTFAAIRKAKTILEEYAGTQGYIFRRAGAIQNFCSFSNSFHAPIGATKKGLVITKSSRKGRFNSLFIDSLCVKSNTTGTHQIELLDSNQNILQSINISLTAGQKTKILVKWDLALEFGQSYYIVWANTTATPAMGDCSCSTAGCCGNHFDYSTTNNVWYQIKGWDGAKCQNKAFGISINAQVKCSVDNLMCDFLSDIKNAILSLTGAEIADAALSPQRNNSTNINAAEWLIAKRAEWTADAATEIRNAAAYKIQQWIKEDSFCIERNLTNAPQLVAGKMPYTAARDIQVAVLQVNDRIQDAFAKPIIDSLNGLKIDYRGIYGTMPTYWGFNLLF